jgi:hypothetical protein
MSRSPIVSPHLLVIPKDPHPETVGVSALGVQDSYLDQDLRSTTIHAVIPLTYEELGCHLDVRWLFNRLSTLNLTLF